MNDGVRNRTARPLSASLIAVLVASAAGTVAAASPLDDAAGDLVLHYDFADGIVDGAVVDVSGGGHHGTVQGSGATVEDGALVLSGEATVDLPAEVFEGQDALTISTWLRNDVPDGNYAALYVGSEELPPSQYWLLNPSNPAGRFKSVITDGLDAGAPWNTESGISPTTASRGIAGPVTGSDFALYTTVITSTSITGYLDGDKIGTVPTSRGIGDLGTELIARIGTSPYSGYGDPHWEGAMGDLKVFTAALTDQQAASQYYEELGDDAISQAGVDEDAAALSLPATTASDLVLPTAGVNGSEIVWSSSDEGVIATDGTVQVPGADTAVTLTADLELAGQTAQREFTVTVTGDLDSTLVLRYDFTDPIDDGTIDDISGNGFDGTVAGTGATVDAEAGVLTLPGGAGGSGAGHVSVPAEAFEGKNTLTISTWLRNRTGSGNYAAMFFGKAASTPLQYWLLNPKNPEGRFKTVITNGNPSSQPWTTEAGVTTGTSATRVQGPVTPVDEWMHMTTVITPTSVSGYLDGELVGTVPVTRTVSQFGADLVAYLGRSSYPDKFFAGDFRDVAVYEAAFTEQQVSQEYWTSAGDDAIDVALEADADAIMLDGTSVTEDVDLPLTGASGSTVTWASSDEAVISTDGAVTRPADANATIALTATFEFYGRTYERAYEVTVIADNPEADLDYAVAQYDLGVSVLWDDITLADSWGEAIAVTWETSDDAAVTDEGIVTRGASAQDATLTATFTRDAVSVERAFDVTVLPEVAGYLGTYIRTPQNDDDTASVHLALSEDGAAFQALNDNKGVLFPSAADVNTDVNREIASPTAFHLPDGGYGLLATIPGTSANDAYVYETDDLVTYANQRRVTFAPGTSGVTRVAVEFDNAIGAYRLLYTAGGTDYEVTTPDFSSFSEPVEADQAASFVSGTFPEGALTTDAIGITQAQFDHLAIALSLERVHSVSVDGFDPLDVNRSEGVELPDSTTVHYSSGDTSRMAVEWDTEGIDFDIPGTYEITGTVQAPLSTTALEPLAWKRADPDVTVGDDGLYYLTGSYPMFNASDPDGYDRVVLRRAETLEGLDAAESEETTIWLEDDHPGYNEYVWAPELAKIGDDWYILFTTSRNTSVWDKQPAMLKYTGGELAGEGPLQAENWETVGYTEPAAGDSIAFSGNFALDMTHFEHDGTDYMVWADKFALSTLRMASVDADNPLELTSESIEITSPEHAWEIESESGTPVNEGPAVLKHDGRIFIAFSSSAVNTSYNISFLWADEDADLLDPASWHKAQYPYLGTGDVPGMYGMGHNSFTVDELGNPVLVYHARSYDDTDVPSGTATNGGLFDPRRNAHARLVHFDKLGMPILDMTPAEELDPALADVTISVTVQPEEGLVGHWPLDETEGTVAADTSGNGLDATYVGGPELQGDAGARLDGIDDYIQLPDDVMDGLDSITVSTEVLVRSGQATPYFIWGLGNPATSSSGDGYLFSTGNPYRATISDTNWQGEQNVNSGANLERGVWKTLTYTLDGATDTGVLYLDGVEVERSESITLSPSDIGDGVTTRNLIGWSNYAADNRLAGTVRNFRIYDRALDAGAVEALDPSDALRVQRDRRWLAIDGATAVTDDIDLPQAGVNGSAITWSSSDPSVITDDGVVTRPSVAEGDASVVLTATLTRGDETVTKALSVDVRAQADDQSIADAAVGALEIVNIDDVRGNLFLPDSSFGQDVVWSSADEAIVGTDGVVSRPEADAAVTLTATVTVGEATATREFDAQVRAAIELAPFEGYGFSYFTGNSIDGEKIYFAASDGNDALHWDELNGGEPMLESEYGTRGLRDPFIIRSPEGDTFYMIATDLSIGRNGDWGAAQTNGSQYLEVWESDDLVNWSEQRHVKVAPDNAGNLWAPEAYYDESIGAYVVFWASKLYPDNDRSVSVPNEMLYSTTRDFVNFSEPQGWQTGLSRIDSTVLEEDGVYHRFTKDEGAGTTGCSDIIQEYSDDLRAPLDEWEFVTGCIGDNAGTGAVEGPSIVKSNPGDVNGDHYYLFVDEYGGRGYIPLQTDDIANPDWQVASDYDLPASPRHGTVFPVTAAELETLRAEIVTADPVKADEDGQVLRYDFESYDGTTLTDVTGNGYDGIIQGGASPVDGALAFTGDDYVDLPDNILAGVEDITIEAEVYLDPALSGNYFIYGLGNTDGSGVGNGYLFTTGNAQYRSSLATGNWSTEQTVRASSALPRGEWVTMVYTLDGDTATLYLNGVEVATGTVTANPGDIGAGFTTANHLGRSNYDADGLFRGQFREFALYNRALSPEEVLAGSGQTDVLLGISLEDESVLKVDPIVNQTERTVVFPVEPGTDLTQLAPVFSTVDGVTSDPASGSVVDLSSEVTYQLGGDSDATWTMEAVEMRSPVLPGLYADPNIIAFGDTYYIYATSDGYPGWGGNEFYTWSSKNLVDWERAEEPFLTLDGEDGDVPWATGNAWAPTAIERDGKYYFYFSGHNAELNRKTIGVAVADHPEGPFVAQPEAMILNNEAVTSGQAIDPHAFKDPVSGTYYLYWGNGSPVMAELADDMVSLEPGTIQGMAGLTGYREGSFMVYRDGIYHLTYSIDDTGSENYRVGYATSDSPEGPWTYRGVILEKDASLGILGTGHNSILNVPGTDDWYIAYHRFAIPGGNGTNRETTIDRLTFNETTGLIEKVTPTLGSVDPQEIETDDPSVESIAVTQPLTKTEYMVGDELDLDGLEVTATWTDNATTVLSEDEYTVSGFDSSTAGDVTVTVTYDEDTSITTTFAVTVAEEPATVESIEVTRLPTTTDYMVGEGLDLAGLEVTATWTDSATTVLSEDEYTVSGFDSSTAGDVTVTVTYDEDTSITTTFAVTVAEETQQPEFTDVDQSLEHYASIMWLAERGISKGWQTDNGREFRPFEDITRDAMAAFLYRYAGSPDVDTSGPSPFVDVNEGNTEFYDAIVWMAQEEISEGWEVDGEYEFRPLEPITRDAMAAFLYRYADEPTFTLPVSSPFEDITPANTEFYDAIVWMNHEGISFGWEVDGGYEYRPFQPTTRDAMAAFLERFHEQIS
ncbi:family 43 glycosylhydrolase [Demequina sp. NBRC 110053]|uniref:family 43 glycosylhydrolase n=1 Tax=Demequina sp. NBRC 110053 TaxID=1570342 RepID=UPI000A0175E4|nr:family 43 glycosylhydrolase [Demequina sp. NBRC 110053]